MDRAGTESVYKMMRGSDAPNLTEVLEAANLVGKIQDIVQL